MRITYNKVKHWAFPVMILPMIIFFVGYLKWYFALLGSAALLIALWRGLLSDNEDSEENSITVSKSSLVALAIFVLIWTYLGGLNGFFFQSSDWPWRNAIFHDLIERSWPVEYIDGTALDYYIGFWLPPAIIAKLVLLVSRSIVAAWTVGRIFLWLWSSLCIFIVLLLIMLFTKSVTKKKQFFATLVFVLFSGLDVVGMFWLERQGYLLDPSVLHLEWWADGLQYSSSTTCLYWVFNQTIMSWLATMCFLCEKTPRNYVLIGLSCFFCGPLPFVGLAVLMIASAIEKLINECKSKRSKEYFKNLFSISNVVLILIVLPVFTSFFMSNAIATGTGTSSIFNYWTLLFATKRFIMFFMLEAGIYLLAVWHANKKSVLFYVSAFLLFFIPCIQIGYSNDFCMRASIPVLLVLVLMCIKTLFDSFPLKGKSVLVKVCAIILIVTLSIGAATPFVEVGRGIYNVAVNKTVLLEKDSYKTLESLSGADNFVVENYEKSFFFQYLAK